MTKNLPVALVIDDEVQIRRFLRAGFELENFSVQEAATAGDGLRIATLKPIDIVILDLALPDMDGAEVVERLRARGAEGEPVVRAGPLTIDFAQRTVSVDGHSVQLSPKEYRVLQVLAQHAGNVVTHQHLLKEVWGAAHANDAHYLRIFVRKLRKKIEKDATQRRILTTELGVGYRLVLDHE